jgi:sulfotransferase
MKNFMFMAGLPRSGSTLISSILNQNPAIYSGPNSPMCGMMWNLERSILASEQWMAYPKPAVMPGVVMGLLNSYYSDIDRPTVIDKSREWALPNHYQVLLRCMETAPRIIMPVRSITEILASFISLVNKNPSSPSFIDREIEARQEFNFYRPPDDTRCDHLMRPKGLIDDCLFGLAYAIQAPEAQGNFHLVEYDDLVSDPETAINGIYDFLGIERFDHDYADIVNVTPEDDNVFGLQGMHDVRPTISRRNIDPTRVLSPYALSKYTGLEFWREA